MTHCKNVRVHRSRSEGTVFHTFFSVRFFFTTLRICFNEFVRPRLIVPFVSQPESPPSVRVFANFPYDQRTRQCRVVLSNRPTTIRLSVNRYGLRHVLAVVKIQNGIQSKHRVWNICSFGFRACVLGVFDPTGRFQNKFSVLRTKKHHNRITYTRDSNVGRFVYVHYTCWLHTNNCAKQ